MGKQTAFRTERDLRQLRKLVDIGTVLYLTVELETRGAPWEDPKQLRQCRVTGRSWLVSDWVVDNAGTLADLVHQGTVYTVRPQGLKLLSEETTQCEGPLDGMGQKYNRRLNSRELEDLETQVATTTKNNAKAGRGKKSSWW
ncbi:hypothetical protein ACIOJG_37515 [Streptomyces anulatus]